MGGRHHTGPWSNEDQKLVNLSPGQSVSLRRPKPPIKGDSAPEEEEELTNCKFK